MILRKNISIFIGFLLIFINIEYSYAIQESRPTTTDSRIKVIDYHPRDVFHFTGYYGYQASIVFSPEEEITNISMGDSTSWQLVPTGNKLFIKPIENNATTNMTLTTNKRTYFFELDARSTSDIRDPAIAFNLQFIYPEDNLVNSLSASLEGASFNDVDLTHPEILNFKYSISGSDDIAPIKIFDDGEFTYLQFRNKNNEMPAIFAVDDNLNESIVNYHLDAQNSNMIIVEQVFKKLALRAGKKITCVFNEAFIGY